MKISLIIPTYNEAKNIKKVIKRILPSLRKYDYEIVVVDDDSPDGTADIVNSLKIKRVRLIRRKGKKDLSLSIMDGFKHAKGDIVGVIDADLSHPPELIPKVIEPIIKENYDISIASRIVKGGGVENWPFIRRFTSWFASLLARPLTNVKDPMSGFFFVKKSKLNYNYLKPRGYKILLEILVKCSLTNFKEVPYIFRNRKYGESKIGSKVILNYIIHLAHLYLFVLKKTWFNKK